MPRCDLIIRDATVFDGTEKARFKADIGVTGDRITTVGDLGGASAEREVIASGRAVAPGSSTRTRRRCSDSRIAV
ncbi:MAG: hypothetical protein JO122_01535 [Acetobacteraceae bacterium]|nr:hypothetical protein [Acetobacteraceae bacterium]